VTTVYAIETSDFVAEGGRFQDATELIATLTCGRIAAEARRAGPLCDVFAGSAPGRRKPE
jgi:hypothetical protein